ncbi:MAG: hypothetical protein HY897_23705 [Deltaproteobacteria bacterium]|nr:hypothetical protein [Deltaproteobacteria bacterium]
MQRSADSKTPASPKDARRPSSRNRKRPIESRRSDQSFQAGIAAGKELVPLTANPYAKGSLEWSEWRAGWADGVAALDCGEGSCAPSSRKPSLDEIELALYFQELDHFCSRKGRGGIPDCFDLMEEDDE